MNNKIKIFRKIIKIKILFFSLILFLFFSFSGNNFVLAFADYVERPLEIKYIPLPEVPTPTSTGIGVANYLRYLYIFFISFSGIIALIVLVIAGFRYITSVGRPEVMKDAKDQILAVLIGMLILFGAWFILNEINPELTDVPFRPLKPIIPPQFSGILLCKKDAPVTNYYYEREEAEKLSKQFEEKDLETQKSLETKINDIKKNLDKWYQEINENCYFVAGKGNLPDEWDDKIKKDGYVYFVPTKDIIKSETSTKEKVRGYGIVLTDKGLTYDVNQWIKLDNQDKPGVWYSTVKISEINSVLPYFVLTAEEVSDGEVIVYEEVNYNRGAEDKKTQKFNTAGNSWQDLEFSPRSLNIGAEGKTIVVLTTGEKETGIVKNGYFFTKDDPNLLKYFWITKQINCPIETVKRGGCPAAKKIAIDYGKIF